MTDTLPPDLLDRLARRAEVTGQSRAAIVETALRRYLAPEEDPRGLFVSAPVKALVEGLYREDMTVGDLKRHGDFGLGTFDNLDGEMVVLDGQVHQLRADGRAYAVPDAVGTPFASVCFFRPDTVEEIDRPLDYDGMMELLEMLTPSPNMIYAIRIAGEFDYVKVRSVPRTENYRPLVEVAREQPEFEYCDVRGDMAGFWTPAFLDSVGVPGYHLHFLTEARDSGGHLLTCRTKRLKVQLGHIPRMTLGLPVTLDYLTAEFTRDLGKDLEEAEKG